MYCPNNAVDLWYLLVEEHRHLQKGYAVLDGFADSVVLSASVWSSGALGRPAEFPRQSFTVPQRVVYNTFLKGNELEAENARRYWNLMFNNGVEDEKSATYEKRIAWYTSTNELLTRHMHKCRSRVRSGVC